MLSQATSHQCGQALLEHVRRGAYPEYEAVIAADLPASAVREISRLIEQAKEEVKVSRQRLDIHLAKVTSRV